MDTIDPAIAGLVLEEASDDDFEIFGQALLAHVLGIEFEPTGGMHDGGQDGFIRPLKGHPSHFVQISTRPDVKTKILATITRLRKVGRTVEDLTYVSSRLLPNRDLIEDEIQREVGVSTRIRDRRWITTQCQRDERSAGLFTDRFAPLVQSIVRLNSHALEVYTPSERMSILAYMEVHSASEPQENDLLTLAVDSAIYLALEGTDPIAGNFRSEEEIREFVEAKFPAVKKRPSLDISKRIARLSSKTGSPRIRHHQKDGGFCLPYEVRSDFSERSISIRNLEVSFWDSVRQRARDTATLTDHEINAVAEIVSYAINKTFEKQGLNLMASLNGAITFEDIKTFEYIRQKTTDLITSAERRASVATVTSSLIRSVFYSSTAEEKEYLFRLFKAFSIEFVIRGDDKVGSYFTQLSRNLYLIVGSDILVRALSEVCVRPENQATQNCLRMLSRAGATLVLTEQVFDEVYGNIRAADLEFENHYKPWERMATLAETQQSDRILIRAYFYSKLEPQHHAKPRASWEQFLGLFGEPRWFRTLEGKDAFAAFLQRKFELKFVIARDIQSAVSRGKASALKDKVQQYKKDERLAWNDAYLALYVEQRRAVTR